MDDSVTPEVADEILAAATLRWCLRKQAEAAGFPLVPKTSQAN